MRERLALSAAAGVAVFAIGLALLMVWETLTHSPLVPVVGIIAVLAAIGVFIIDLLSEEG